MNEFLILQRIDNLIDDLEQVSANLTKITQSLNRTIKEIQYDRHSDDHLCESRSFRN